MKTSKQTMSPFREGIVDSLPITISIILFGAIYGMLSLQAGLTAWQSMAMSLFVFAGSAQFTALSMLAENANVWAIVLATFLLNSRHFLMGLSLAPHYQNFSNRQVNLLSFFLTDESYAITLNRLRQREAHAPYIFGVCLSMYAAWALGTWVGTFAGQWIPDPAALGLGFSFTAMFLALSFYQLTSLVRILTFIGCGAAAVLLALILPNGLHLLAAGLIAFLIGYAMPLEAKESKTEMNAKEAESV